MHQLTIRGFDEALERKIQELARREGLSLNKAVLQLLRRGAGLEPQDRREAIGSSLDHLAGTWTDEEIRLMREAEADFEVVDPELWK